MRHFIMLIGLFLTSCSTAFKTPIIIAHRGASSVAPENTLAAFAKAAEYGAGYFELDIWLSKDDSLICIHDDSLHRTTNGVGLVADYAYSDLRELDAGSWFDAEFAGERLPTLKEALLLARETGIGVCIEVKSGTSGIVGQIYNLVIKLDMQNHVVLFSFDANQIAEGKGVNSGIPALYLVGDIELADIDFAKQIRANAVGVGGDATKELVDAAHDRGLEFWKWTVNDVAEMKALIDMGVDGIITDDPQTLKSILVESEK